VFPLHTSVAYRSAPFVTWALIAANALAFLYEISLSHQALQAFLYHYALVPARYGHPEWALRIGLSPTDYWPILTNTFLHGDWLHIIGNMWFLLIFGPPVEDRLGRARYLGFYLLAGVGASVAHTFVNADSAIPALGASGAIAGVMGAFMRLFPLARVIILVPIFFFPFFFELAAFVVVGLWFAIQLVQGVGAVMAPAAGGGVAWWAHVGGFAFGWLIVPLLRQGERRHRRYHPDEGVLGFKPSGSTR